MCNYKIFNNLKDVSSVCIIGHLEPDADSLCSMILLKHFLNKTFNITDISLFSDYTKMPNEYSSIIDNEILNPEPKMYDLVIMIDSPTLDRAGKFKSLFINAKTKLVIDHHQTNDFYGDYNIVKPVSSSCEIMYDIMQHFNYEFSKKDLEMVYTGIITDTNNLSVGAFDSHTFEICSACAKQVNCSTLYKHFLANHSIKNLKLFALAINNICSYENNKIIISHITKEESSKLKAETNDFLGIVNRLTGIEGSQLICLIIPRGDNYYVTLRASNDFDVSQIAKSRQGGGHKGAAAYTSHKNIEYIHLDMLTEFRNQLNKKNNRE